uniref:Endonuclease V family protein n=2 Tax=Solanum TaxID=4107 RepID=M1CUW7_SOLTU
MRSSEGSLKPIFISVGHRISLATAIEIVRMTCRFRVPEPIRQADIRSRERLRNNQ